MKFPRVAALCLAIGACSAPEPVRIAVVMTLDGVLAAQLAAEDVRAAGGIRGRPLELVLVEESHSDPPRQAIATAERLTPDPSVLAVIGHRGSSASLAASQVYNAGHLPQLAPTSTAPLYTQAGPYSFRLVASDVHQAEFIAARIALLSPAPRIAVLYVNDDYGRAFQGHLKKALAGGGIVPVFEAPYLEGDADFTARRDGILQALEKVQPDLLLWLGRSQELKLLRGELRSALPRVRILGGDAMADGSYAGLPEFAGDWMVSLVDLTAPRTELQRFSARYEKVSGRALTDEAVLTYDAVGLIAAALRAGGAGREGIRSYLASMGTSDRAHPGITGGIQLDADGDARPAYALLEVTAGGWRGVR